MKQDICKDRRIRLGSTNLKLLFNSVECDRNLILLDSIPLKGKSKPQNWKVSIILPLISFKPRGYGG